MDKKQVTDLRSELLDSRFGAKSISTIAESKRFPLHEMRDDVAKTGSTKKNIRNPQPSTCVA